MRLAVLPVLLALLLPSAAPAAERRTIAVDVPAGAEAVAEALRGRWWLRWIEERRDGPQVVVAPGAVGETRILIRPLPAGEAVAELLAGLPVHLGEGVLELDGTAYRDARHTLAVRLPRAERTTWLVTGSESDRLASLAGLLIQKEAGLGIWGRDGEPFDYLLSASWWLERSGRWRATEVGFGVDRGAERDDFRERDAYYAGMRDFPGRRLWTRGPRLILEHTDALAMARRLDAAIEPMASLLPLELKAPVRLVIEGDYVAQGRYLSQIGAAVLAGDGAVHAVYHPDDEHAVKHRIAAALLARAGLAEGLPPWIADGAALWLSGTWFGRDWRDWLPRLAAARVLPSAEQLLAAERQADASAPLWTPVAASLIDAIPGETLRQKLAAMPGEPAVAAHLARLARLPPPPALERRAASGVPFLRGVSLAMLNTIDGGYHAPSVDERLERLARLGADAVSLMPFAYQRSPDEPALKFLNASPTSETDVGVLHAARRARAAGFRVLWKPHIWLSHGSWPGEIAMPDDAAWADWWQSYRRYVAHHALLAEWSGAELLSIGVELGRTLERRREWDALIDSVRWLYSGALTYAGNWHADYDRAPFWHRLDYVGIDAYFPLASADDADPAALDEGARRVVAQLRAAAERFGKPVLLTEVGFAARAGAWTEPHREGGDFSAEHQAAAYRALLEALGRPPWLAGLFAWKAFSADRGGDAGTRADFRFLDRPAETVLAGYFAPSAPSATLHTSNR